MGEQSRSLGGRSESRHAPCGSTEVAASESTSRSKPASSLLIVVPVKALAVAAGTHAAEVRTPRTAPAMAPPYRSTSLVRRDKHHIIHVRAGVRTFEFSAGDSRYASDFFFVGHVIFLALYYMCSSIAGMNVMVILFIYFAVGINDEIALYILLGFTLFYI